MEIFTIIALVFLVGCAVFTGLSKKLLVSVIVFMSYGVIMSIVWMILKAPDLAITEAAVGVGIDSILMFLTLKSIGVIGKKK